MEKGRESRNVLKINFILKKNAFHKIGDAFFHFLSKNVIFSTWPHRLVVRTTGSQSVNRSSTLREVTNKKALSFLGQRFYIFIINSLLSPYPPTKIALAIFLLTTRIFFGNFWKPPLKVLLEEPMKDFLLLPPLFPHYE